MHFPYTLPLRNAPRHLSLHASPVYLLHLLYTPYPKYLPYEPILPSSRIVMPKPFKLV